MCLACLHCDVAWQMDSLALLQARGPTTGSLCLQKRSHRQTAELPFEAEMAVALPRVAERGIGLGYLLELFFCHLVPWVLVGVKLERQLAIRLLDFIFPRTLPNAERSVVVRR